MNGGKSRKRSSQWAAQFLVAAELERKGYEVAFTTGNGTPVADLMVGHPKSGDMFWIDVKGLRSKTAWMGKPKPKRPNLFYVLVFVAQQHAADRFFILTQTEFNALIEQYRITHPNQKPIGGFDWTDPIEFEATWAKLPSWNVD